MAYVFDVAIIGGGINGCGCAADAALRGLSVLLCDQGDLASQTSSKSTKLIHGGLRYLEMFDFSLVKKALAERQKLLELAPHLIRPQPFVLPYQHKMRPYWLLRFGLFLYDHLSKTNQLPKTKLIQRKSSSMFFSPLNNSITKGFYFFDCATDDARLTITNALQAKEHGATILSHTKLIKAEVVKDQWQLTLKPQTGRSFQIKTKVVINAAGPWISSVNQILNVPLTYSLSLVKGSHVVAHKLYEGNQAYMLQHSDKRIIFTIPYFGYTLIGTTDHVLSTAPEEAINIESGEIDYLLRGVNLYFKKKLHPRDIITTWSGIRPLVAENGKASNSLSRDYACHYSDKPAPVVTIYGGKITTYRQLSLQAINHLDRIFPNLQKSKTNITPLPGACTESYNYYEYQQYAREKYFWLDDETLERYLTSYGTRTELVLAGCKKLADLGVCFTNTLYQVEVDYLQQEEWVRSIDDILWRRTKLGLHINGQEKLMLAEYLLSCQNVSQSLI